MKDLDDLIKDLPKEIQEAIKRLCRTVYDRGYDNGLRVGAYSISDRILTLLRSEVNPAKAKAKAFAFAKEETADRGAPDGGAPAPAELVTADESEKLLDELKNKRLIEQAALAAVKGARG